MREFLRRLCRRPGISLELLIATFLVALLNMASPIFIMQILRRYIAFGFHGTMVFLTLGMVVSVILLFMVRAARTRLAQAVSTAEDEKLADAAFTAMARMDPTSPDAAGKDKAGETFTRLQQIQAAYDGTAVGAVLDAPFSLLYIVMALFINPPLAFIGLAGMMVMFGAGRLALGFSEAARRRYLQEDTQQRGHAATALQHADTVRAFRGGNFLRRVWSMQIRNVANLRQRMAESRGAFQSVMRVVLLLTTTGVYVVGAREVVNGDLMVGALIAISILSSRAVQTVGQFTQTMLLWANAREARKELAPLLSRTGDDDEDKGARPERFHGGLSLRGLGFTYPGAENPLFTGLDADLPPGAVLAVSGHNGAGKTTFMRLLAGLLTPTEGSVSVDNADLADLSREWWRGQISYLPQDPGFFQATWRENILVANPGLDEEAVMRIVRAVGLESHVMATPGGLDEPLQEQGRNLPLGIRRRLALARALATGGRLLLMDEPTEGLDPDGRKKLLELMELFTLEGRTIVVTSHDAEILKLAHARLIIGREPTPVVEMLRPEKLHKPVAEPHPESEAPAPLIADPTDTATDAPFQPTALATGRGHALFWASTVACAVFLAWASIHPLDIVSHAPGRVIPSSRVKRVQHYEGGIVREIGARRGDHVQKGQPLLVLEHAMQDAGLGEIRARIQALEAEVARLTAEAANNGKEPAYPETLRKEHPELVRQSLALFHDRKRRLASELATQRAVIDQIRASIHTLEVGLKNADEMRGLLDREMAITKSLYDERLVTELAWIELQRTSSRLDSEIGQTKAQLAKARATLAEERQKLSTKRKRFLARAEDQLQSARQELEEFRQRVRKSEDVLQRTVVRSPVDGIVQGVDVLGVGEVVRPGQIVMTVVPAEDQLVIEARLSTDEIGYVQRGQTAEIHLDFQDAHRFGILAGEVEDVSPDAFTVEGMRPFYLLRIRSASDVFERDGHTYHLYPGMTVETYIHHGTRTVLEYILSPYFIDSP